MDEDLAQTSISIMQLQKKTRHNHNGNLNPNWHGGYKMLDGYKYIWTPKHPNATKEGYVVEHRLVMEKIIGRFLNGKEVVHHIDGNKLNNSETNLTLFLSAGDHFIKAHLKNRDCRGRFL